MEWIGRGRRLKPGNEASLQNIGGWEKEGERWMDMYKYMILCMHISQTTLSISSVGPSRCECGGCPPSNMLKVHVTQGESTDYDSSLCSNGNLLDLSLCIDV